MGTFSASLRAVGDVKALPATVEIVDGMLKIAAGSTEIGSWPLDEVHLEEIPTGYRMAAEGDQILIELNDVSSFSEALANGSKKKRARLRKSRLDDVTETKLEVPTAAKTAAVPNPGTRDGSAPNTRSAAEPAPPPTSPKPKTPGFGQRIVDGVDTLLIKAKKRFGAYLPDFMFSRAMFVITLGVLTTMILFPGVFSTALLISGGLTVLFGAIVYTDSVLASRFLPGRATPQQALLLGLGVLLFGVLLGVIAR